jgi:hypothetical protein
MRSDQDLEQMTISSNGSKHTLSVEAIEEGSISGGDDSDDSNDEFYDAEEEQTTIGVVTLPSVSIPTAEGDSSDIDEDDEYSEKDDTSSKRL